MRRAKRKSRTTKPSRKKSGRKRSKTGARSRFSKLRERKGLSIDQAAALLDISRRTAYRYERGDVNPRAPMLRALEEGEQEPYSVDTKAGFRFIDLFAGIGGLRIGFEKIGGQCVFTSEWDKYSRKTYAENFEIHDEHSFGGDVREFSKNPSLIPQHDVLLAGFPCQPFSIAGVSKKNALGRPHGFECDTQGTLFFDVKKILAHHRPAVFLLENVRNLQSHDGGRTFRTIMEKLEGELGYHVAYRVVSSEPWVPQKRERIFIVGFRDRTSFDFSQLSIPKRPWPTLGDILLPADQVDAKYTLTEHLWNYLQAYKEKHSSQGNGFGFGLFGPDDVTRTLSARYYKDGSEVLVKQTGNRPRRLTPRECARLMGFETTGGAPFKIPVSDTQAYKQFGNAVVVPVVEAVASLMQPHIEAALTGRVLEKTTGQPALQFEQGKKRRYA